MPNTFQQHPSEEPLHPEVRDMLAYLENNGSPAFKNELAGLMAFYKKEPVERGSELIQPVQKSISKQVQKVLIGKTSTETNERSQTFLRQLMSEGYELKVSDWIRIIKKIADEKFEDMQKSKTPVGFFDRMLGRVAKIEKPDPAQTAPHEVMEYLLKTKGALKRSHLTLQQIKELAHEHGLHFRKIGEERINVAMEQHGHYFVVTYDGWCLGVWPQTGELVLDPDPIRA